MNYLESGIRSYVEKCFMDAFKSEGRDYRRADWDFEYIMVKNSKGIFQMYPIMKCRYSRVWQRVNYRLKNNMFRNFGIKYGDTEEMYCSISNDSIEYNSTQAMFKCHGDKYFFGIYDDTNPCVSRDSEGRVFAYTYKALILQYFGLTVADYNKMLDRGEEPTKSEKFRDDWGAFESLYKETFGEDVGSRYEIVCSSNLKRM